MQFNNQPQQKMKIKDMTTLHLRKLNGRPPLRHGFLLISLVLACSALSVTPNIAMADQNVSFRVQLRHHVFANVVSTVVTNPSFATVGLTELTLPGLLH